MTLLRIPARFNGPPGSGHGGYTCGLAATLLDFEAAVELRAPPPLDTPLTVRETDDGVELHQDETLVVAARRSAPPEPTEVSAVSLDDAARAAEQYRGFHEHPFPTCFVCGPERASGDGLRIFAGPTGDGATVAAPWTPASWLAGDDGAVAPIFVWAALDCPSAFGGMEWFEREHPGEDLGVAVLASMRVRQEAPVPAGEELVVVGWGSNADGRKRFAGSSIQTADGEILATAECLWIRLRDT